MSLLDARQNIFLFTASYPFGNSETFLENEIEILCDHFEKVIICPKISNSKEYRKIPNNAEILSVSQFVNKLNILKKTIYTINRFIFSLKDIARKPMPLNMIRYRIAYDKQVYARYYNLSNYLDSKDLTNSIFYSYWFEDWATILSELKRKKCIKKFISRAHGFDLYEERRKENFIPFRPFQLKMVDKLFFISKDGVNYMKKKYPAYSSKFELSYLGTDDHGLAIYKPSDTIELLSISNIIPVKRVHLIVETLRKVNVKLNWTHFGDGELMHEIESYLKSLPSNISVSLKGRIPNKNMLEFIKDHHFDLFVNVSSSEGLPVSIMEAISFGIPVFATDAGGTNEIVNNITGKLYPTTVDTYKMARDISSIKESKYSTPEYRNGVREFWMENFDAEKNYTRFTQQIKY